MATLISICSQMMVTNAHDNTSNTHQTVWMEIEILHLGFIIAKYKSHSNAIIC